jgi:PhnB protein
MQIQPYLFFDGRCDEAIRFYQDKLGAEVTMLMRFKDAPKSAEPAQEGCAPPAGSENKVMHASLRIGDAMVLMSDGQCQGNPQFKGFSLSLTAPDDAAAKRLFNALSDSGQVVMPLDETFFASSFGMVADRFGVTWMVYVPAKVPA